MSFLFGLLTGVVGFLGLVSIIGYIEDIYNKWKRDLTQPNTELTAKISSELWDDLDRVKKRIDDLDAHIDELYELYGKHDRTINLLVSCRKAELQDRISKEFRKRKSK